MIKSSSVKKFLIFVFVLLLFQPLFAVNLNFKAYYSPELSHYKEPKLVNSAKIVSVDIVIDIYFFSSRCNVSVEYLQTKENSTSITDKVFIWGNVSQLLVSDSLGRNLLISAFYNLTSGYTEIIYRLPRALSVGEKYSFYIAFLSENKEEQGTLNFDFRIFFTQSVSILSITTFLTNSLSLYSSNPEPQTISTIGEKLKLTWNYADSSNFVLLIKYKSLENVFLVSPLVWEVGYIPRSANKIKQIFTLTNILNVHQQVNITANVTWISTKYKTIDLLPLEQKKVTIEIKLQAGEQSGKIIFQSNLSKQVTECTVHAYVVADINPWMIVSIFLFSFLIASLVIIFFIWQNSKEEVAKIEKKKTKKYDLGKLSKFLNEKEEKIMRIIIEKPGQNQASVAAKTGLSQATVSRILNKLEGKEIINRTSVGMSTLIYPNEKASFFKFIEKDNEKE
ncbi:MAG: winged helix-turn-helix transcriptional regulator [Candidatus Heimdallarchaeum endolithica]|uniref:Winged helix-turn-helix transcriptional regulator n=1 Tax=Candidatus Heimdallarchaeum endolithica TaxID=2876572 RepID=A0A9Y1BSU9_9ARCH|nr:MAG: winged helix-turn-helix transcriptional regulator [Candidatus Heimdallarchaeum endolithica]